MTPRSLHQLPPVIWVVTLEITDTPAPGESYLDAREVQGVIANNMFASLPTGITAAVKTLNEPTKEF